MMESNHEVLFFKWHYSSMKHNVWKNCEASFVLLELKWQAEKTELLFLVFTFRKIKRFMAKPQKNSQRWIVLQLILYKGQHLWKNDPAAPFNFYNRIMWLSDNGHNDGSYLKFNSSKTLFSLRACPKAMAPSLPKPLKERSMHLRKMFP